MWCRECTPACPPQSVWRKSPPSLANTDVSQTQIQFAFIPDIRIKRLSVLLPQPAGAAALVLVELLLGLIDRQGAELAGVAGRQVVLPLKVSSHVVLFVGDVGETELAREFPIGGSLRVSRHHVCTK